MKNKRHTRRVKRLALICTLCTVILVVSTGNATVTPSKTAAYEGDVIELDIKAQEGYRIDKVTVNDKVITSDNYSFVMPASSAAIRVYTALEDKDGYIVDGFLAPFDLIVGEIIQNLIVNASDLSLVQGNSNQQGHDAFGG